jgi:hypothetical protein
VKCISLPGRYSEQPDHQKHTWEQIGSVPQKCNLVGPKDTHSELWILSKGSFSTTTANATYCNKTAAIMELLCSWWCCDST